LNHVIAALGTHQLTARRGPSPARASKPAALHPAGAFIHRARQTIDPVSSFAVVRPHHGQMQNKRPAIKRNRSW
jgi:hypothetical protein